MRLFSLLLSALLSVSLSAQTIPGFSPLVDMIKPDPVLVAGTFLNRIAVDATGDVYVVARTISGADVPGATKIGAAFGYSDILIAKMDARLELVRFMTLIGAGTATAPTVKAMSVDAAGNVYVTGTTYSEDFPYTQRLGSSRPSTFLVKVSAAGDKLIYATQLALDVTVIDVDASGAVYLGGRTDPGPVVVKVSPTGDAILFQKNVGTQLEFVQGIKAMPTGRAVYLTSSTLGGLNSAGSEIEFSIPMAAEQNEIDHPNLLDADAAGNLYVNGWGPAVAKFSPTGALLGVRRMSTIQSALNVTSMSVSSDGAVYLVGDAGRASFPTRNALETCRSSAKPPYGSAGSGMGGGYEAGVVVYGADGTLQYSSLFPADTSVAALSNDAKHLYVYANQMRYGAVPSSYWNGLQRLDLSRIPTTNRLSPSCLAHGASYGATPASPGAIMTLYGSNLGPQTGESFTLVNNMVPTELSGTGVTVDGVPAPILYAQESQINFIIPWGAKTQGTVEVCVNRTNERACLDSAASAIAPAFFLSEGVSIVVHQDGSLNSKTNPVRRGQYVSLYVTGTGTLSGPLTDGGVWDLTLRHMPGAVTGAIIGDRQPCGLTLGCGYQQPPPSFPVDVVYAGSAPFLVQGASQINIRIPESVPVGQRSLPVRFDGPGAASGGDTVTIWIAP